MPELLEQLPQKDRTAFRTVHKLYDDRKFNKAAKSLEPLLAKHPTCIEFLSLKALILRNIPDRKEEGLESVKKALKLDIRNSTAWRVLGNFHRLEGNFNEALKSFKRAVQCNPSDPQMLKDLSFLQLHLRQWVDFLATRNLLAECHPESKANFYAVPLALHLAGSPEKAAERLLTWWSLAPEFLGDVAPIVDAELSLYLVRLLEEAGMYDRALAHSTMALRTGVFKAKNAMQVFEARLALRLNKIEEARQTYLDLVHGMPENLDYVLGHFICSPVSKGVLTSPFVSPSELTIPFRCYPESLTANGMKSSDWIQEPLVSVLETRQSLSSLDQYGRRAVDGSVQLALNCADTWRILYGLRSLKVSIEKEQEIIDYADNLLQRTGLTTCESIEFLPLAFLRSEAHFKELLSRLLKKKLVKVSASTVKTVETLYEISDVRRQWIVEVLESLKPELTQLPQILCTALIHLSDLSCVTPSTQFESALDGVSSLLAEFPTFIELGVIKHDALVARGRHAEAAIVAEGLMTQDKADRYLNHMCARSMMRAGRIKEGLAIHKVFSRQSESTKNATETVRIDMQDVKLELALAQGYESLHVWDRAAYRYNHLFRRYSTMRDDAYDFYFYCLKRASLTTLVDYVSLIANLESHRPCVEGAIRLIDIYNRKLDGCLTRLPFPTDTAGDETSSKLTDTGYKGPTPSPHTALPAVADEPHADTSYKFNDITDPVSEINKIFDRLKESQALNAMGVLQRQYLHLIRTKAETSRLLSCLESIKRLTGDREDHPDVVPYLSHYRHIVRGEELGTDLKDLLERFKTSGVAPDYLAAVATEHLLSWNKTITIPERVAETLTVEQLRHVPIMVLRDQLQAAMTH
eukprot:Blabericola_migrator_1__13036@NODE_875_length_6200_cov_91_101745_g619_i0_p1_GENE_NODE_875_length_6200_cov_91_101745_g619_i0NODE_875_length_6200_cov_91_101745_g619_i0_p1_ORF_typecomplete_len864_score194_92NARP1/PF12569_8/0_11NARP1/PF12569_8/3_3e51TPR_19/PF14559_6/33TPR_19/PF14559_6/3_2TPR_19/PF14559_6/0_0012TPR_19/PF14559_6/4_5TPR_19/PF14559_6/17TPR_19/PF14559_6/4_9TPR_15/PF13429_6/0_67TPR_15/PF13429_6/2_6e10TPR_15/PF13429_6/9_6TPR_15/PF13429_6/1_1e03ChAPs/PF09295_10/2_1e09ChAPs/PF09295_10/86ChAP